LLELLRPEDDDFVMEEKKKLSATAKKLEEWWDKNLKIAHKVWFIFEAYEDLLNEKITLDEFLATWDITSERNISKPSKSSIDVLNWIIEWRNNDENTVFILDSISFVSLAKKDKETIQNRAKDHNCELVFC
jgi:hypothetical protein